MAAKFLAPLFLIGRSVMMVGNRGRGPPQNEQRGASEQEKCMKRELCCVVAIAAVVVALGGCGRAPAPASSAAVSQIGAQPCASSASSGCQQVSEEMKKAAQQYAEGLHAEYPVATKVYNYYTSHSKLPNGKIVLQPMDATEPNGTAIVRSVSVGPTPGVITVTWADTAVSLLAGKSLVLEPVESKRDPYLCWKVGAATSVPEVVRQINGPKIIRACF
ncbi:MAG: hypothetical protein EPN36_03595 [Rhodanobacteraceae bacterium]|nr:MAG: hypothetical protein EPN36_03595 [Rhodanobacteraceae bacterium]